MAAKSERLETRISASQRATIEHAARLAGTSVSAFVVDAAVERAKDLIALQASTAVPAEYFDRLLDAIDRADMAPTLARAARRAARRPRIARR